MPRGWAVAIMAAGFVVLTGALLAILQRRTGVVGQLTEIVVRKWWRQASVSL